jgi:hypothetical protein
MSYVSALRPLPRVLRGLGQVNWSDRWHVTNMTTGEVFTTSNDVAAAEYRRFPHMEVVELEPTAPGTLYGPGGTSRTVTTWEQRRALEAQGWSPYDTFSMPDSGTLKQVSEKTSSAHLARFPWNTFSTETRALQNSINDALEVEGYETITADGKLGPRTCGAARMLVNLGKGYEEVFIPATCSQYVDPTPRSKPADPTVQHAATIAPPIVVPVPAPAPLPAAVPEVVAYQPPDESFPWLLVLAAVAAVSLTTYAATRKKKPAKAAGKGGA